MSAWGDSWGVAWGESWGDGDFVPTFRVVVRMDSFIASNVQLSSPLQ